VLLYFFLVSVDKRRVLKNTIFSNYQARWMGKVLALWPRTGHYPKKTVFKTNNVQWISTQRQTDSSAMPGLPAGSLHLIITWSVCCVLL
jgi:hypothetical protein